MPITVFDNSIEKKEELIKQLSSEIDFLFKKIKEMKSEDDLFKSGTKLLQKFNCEFEDDSKNLRHIFVFIAMLVIENNTTLKNMLLSESEVDDLSLIKNGITTLQEGCKRLIGFYIVSKKGGFVNDTMIKESLLYQIHYKFKINNPDLHADFEKQINRFRDNLEKKDIKTLRDKLIHYQKENKDKFNPFDFIGTILEIDCDDVFHILFDYCIFLRFITKYIDLLMISGYR